MDKQTNPVNRMEATEIIIEPARQSDNETLARLIRGVFEEYDAPRRGTVYSDPTTDSLYELFQTPQSALWVARAGSNVAGCCGIYPSAGLPEGCAELVKFYAAKEARGKGVGARLLQKSLDCAKELGYAALYLESLPEFSTAISLYQKFGFAALDKPLGYSEHPSCTIWMLKKL